MQKICTSCGSSFEITKADLDFYDNVSPVLNNKKYALPPPTKCPECRERLRYTFRHERALYNRKCDVCDKSIIAIYAPEKKYTVYCPDCFFASSWDATSFEQEYDFTRSFFEQFDELKRQVPRLSIDILKCENSEYSNISINNKNCYLVFATANSENCYYTRKLISSNSCMDCSYGEILELCYECTDCYNCYELLFSEKCSECSSSAFLLDCMGVSNCFMCSNLRNKQYCFLNKQLSEEEYKKQVNDIRSSNTLSKWQEEFKKLKESSIHKENENLNAENCLGNYLINCKNCHYCFDIHHSEDCKYCSEAVTGIQSSMDCSFITIGSECDYECATCSNNTKHCSFCSQCRDNNFKLLYCDAVYSSENCFGCVGLQHKEYCILNKQFTKDEYEELVEKIIENMQSMNEWGQFFPPALSPFDYNETMAQEFYPFSQMEAIASGFSWRDIPDEIPDVEKIIPAKRLPDSVNDIPDDILNWAIKCEATGRPFRIVKKELEFYRSMGLPVPHLHPDERHKNRRSLRNPRKFWKRKCDKCKKEIQTTYAPERPETVYCEECYLKEVY